MSDQNRGTSISEDTSLHATGTTTENLAPQAADPEEVETKPRSLWKTIARGVFGTWSGRIGLILFAIPIFIAYIGPFLSPNDPAAIVGVPLQPPSADLILGTDVLGRDVLSRFLHGGWLLITVALAGVLTAYVIGAPIGLLAAYRRQRPVDATARAITNMVISIPPVIFSLILIAAAGRGMLIVFFAIVLTQAPPIVQIFRGFGLSVVSNEYVEAAVARGEKTASILFREIAPNVRNLFVADVGVRFCWSVMLIAGISFLGFGQAPPAADWGLMISENRLGLTIQPLSVAVPALAIAALTIGLTLLAEAIARSIGRDGGPRG